MTLVLAENLDEEPFWIERGKVHADKFFFRIYYFHLKGPVSLNTQTKGSASKRFTAVFVQKLKGTNVSLLP